MKVLSLIFLVVLNAVGVYAQGTLYFSNHVPSVGLNAPVFDTDGKSGATGYQFQVQLYAGSSAGSLAPVGPPAGFGSEPGYFIATFGTLDRVIPGVLPTDTAFAQVRVWSYFKGSSYDEVAAAGGKHGQSEIFTVVTGGDTKGGTQPPSFPGYMTELKSFSLTGVDPAPEPTVTVLLALAVGGILFWRQRKLQA